MVEVIQVYAINDEYKQITYVKLTN